MIDAVAKAAGVPAESARRAYMLSGDLTRTAEIALAAGDDGLRDVGFELFRPVLPMLASAGETVADAFAGFDRAAVEWKVDGIRIQIHRRGSDVRVYTRNLNDVTDALAGTVDPVSRLHWSRPSSTARRSGARRSCSTCCTWTERTCSTRRSKNGARASRRSHRS